MFFEYFDEKLNLLENKRGQCLNFFLFKFQKSKKKSKNVRIKSSASEFVKSERACDLLFQFICFDRKLGLTQFQIIYYNKTFDCEIWLETFAIN